MDGGMADPAPVVSAVAAAPVVSTCIGRARAKSRSGRGGAHRRYGGGALTDTVKGTRWTGGVWTAPPLDEGRRRGAE